MISVRGPVGEYALLSGNETGILLLDYICSRRIAAGTMPADPVMVKTIVTSDMASQVAENYDVRVIDGLTGFKFIGEQIGFMEAEGKEDNYIFGMEESYGYLTGGYVRDKDAVDGAFMICEMFAYYATKGIGLIEKLDELYKKYGYRLNTLHSYEFEGSAGMTKMQGIMCNLRENPIEQVAGKKVLKCIDYSLGIDELPKSDVMKYLLADNCSLVIRPSGTEPKLKSYVSVTDSSMRRAEQFEQVVVDEINRYFS